MHVEQTRLGDLNTLFINSPGATASSVQMWFRAGSALEDHSNQGIAHFLEHMFFKGTPGRPGPAIAQEVESFGGEINAFTSFDYTCYYINAPASKIPRALDILLDMVTAPMFKAEDFPAERDVVFEEYRRALDNPSQFHFMRLQESCFQGGYQHPILGREDTIRSFSEEQLRTFRRRFYNLQNALLVVAGDLSERRPLEEMVTRFRLPAGEQSAFGEFKMPDTPQVNVHPKPIRQATLTLAISAPGYTDDAAASEDLAVNCLAHGETSRLYQALVAESSLCNGVAGSTMYFAHGGCHMVKASFPMQNLPRVLKTFEATLTQLLSGGVSATEVGKIRNQYVASKVYEKESLEAFAFTLGHGFAQNGDIFCEEGFIQRIKETPHSLVGAALPRVFSRPVHATLQVPEGTKTAPAEKVLREFQARISKIARSKAAKSPVMKRETSSHDPAVAMVEIVPGIKLLHRINKLTPTFVLHHYVKGGLSTERARNCGQHNLMSRLLTYGYKGMPYQQLKLDLEARSASLSGFAGKNAYGLTMHGQTADFDVLLGHFSGSLLTPDMPEKFFKHERQILLRMLDNQKEDPVKQAFRHWYQLVFNAHPYALDSSGTPESVKGMSSSGLKRLHATRMAKEEMVFTYCGDLDLETVAEKLRSSLRPLKGRKGPKPERHEWKGKKGVHLHLEMKREQVQIIIGKPAYKLTAKEDLFLKMLTAYLSGQGSELFVEVRDRQGLCYAVQPVHVTALEAGCWGIYIGSGHDKRKKAEAAILAILKRLSEKGIERTEFDRVKDTLDGQQQLALQTNEDYAQFYSVPALHGLGLDFQHEGHRRVRDAAYNDFQSFLRKFLADGWNVVTVGPSGSAA